jgi:cell division protein FtsW
MSVRAESMENRIDWYLVLLVGTLLSFGLIMLTSASMSVAESNTGQPFYYLLQQLVAVAAGFLCAFIVLQIPTDIWEQLAPVSLLVAILLLIAVVIPGVGREVNGSTRWLSVAGFNLQVSEPARLMVLMYISGYAVRHRDDLGKGILEFCRPMFVVMLVCGLLIVEPDFGATVVMLLISMSVLFVAGVPLRYFLMLCGVVALLLIGLAVSAPYRLARLTGFTDPWSDPFDSGFQLTQSLIAIGSGEWFGVGLGNSVQKLFYLPEAHTDFVFAVIAEEFGVAGTVVLIGLFAALIWRALSISMDAAERDRYFQAYLAFGIAVWQGAQVFINLGVNLGILPTKGLTLPLISYGRSSLIVTLVALTLLLRIDMENRALRSTAKSYGKKSAAKSASKSFKGQRK